MARLVVCTANKPYKYEINGEKIAICLCGLSKKKPYCDGSHRKTKDEEEGKLYIYDENGRTEVKPL